MNVQVSDTTGDDSSTAAKKKRISKRRTRNDEYRSELQTANYKLQTILWVAYLKLERVPCLPGGTGWPNNLPALVKRL